MKVKELIERLEFVNPNLDVMIGYYDDEYMMDVFEPVHTIANHNDYGSITIAICSMESRSE